MDTAIINSVTLDAEIAAESHLGRIKLNMVGRWRKALQVITQQCGGVAEVNLIALYIGLHHHRIGGDGIVKSILRGESQRSRSLGCREGENRLGKAVLNSRLAGETELTVPVFTGKSAVPARLCIPDSDLVAGIPGTFPVRLN